LIAADGPQRNLTPCVLLCRFDGVKFEGPRVLCVHRGSRHIQHLHIHPRFTPDGGKVLFTADPRGYGQLFLAEVPAFEELPALPYDRDRQSRSGCPCGSPRARARPAQPVPGKRDRVEYGPRSQQCALYTCGNTYRTLSLIRGIMLDGITFMLPIHKRHSYGYCTCFSSCSSAVAEWPGRPVVQWLRAYASRRLNAFVVAF
jgi:hypothetical protein